MHLLVYDNHNNDDDDDDDDNDGDDDNGLAELFLICIFFLYGKKDKYLEKPEE